MPATIIGLILAVSAVRGGRVRVVDGVVEACGPVLRWGLSRLIPIPGGAAAITLGHVVLGADASALRYSRDHERVHVTQYEQWGPLFLPAYCAASLWARARGGHFYFDNCFERAACDASTVPRQRRQGQLVEMHPRKGGEAETFLVQRIREGSEMRKRYSSDASAKGRNGGTTIPLRDQP